MKISISFKLRGVGWADCSVIVNGKEAVLTASYLEDALGNLSEAILRIAEGEKLAYAIFAEEPGEYRWRFTRNNEKDISAEILWFDDWKGLRQSDDKGEIILSFDCSTLVLVRRIIICLSEVLNKYGLDGYKDKWSMHEFPVNNYNSLRNILPTLK